MAQLLQNALCGTALILAAALLRRVLKARLTPGARLALWGLCLFRLLTPAFPRSALSLWGLLPRTGTAAPAAPVINAAPAPSLGVGNAPDPTAPVWTFTPAPVELPAVFPWKTVLLAVWLGVGVALTIRYALSWNRTRREVACAIPLERDDPRYAPLPPFARLREGPMEGAPLTFGAVKPTVVLFPGLSGEALECVLAHEGVHASRRDNLWHYAMALALVVHWWNPAVWLMARLLRRDIELSCDRAALKKLGADRRGDYARALVSLATRGEGPAFCHSFGQKAAEERIISIMKFKKTTIWGAVLSLALVVGATVAFASEPKTDDGAVQFHGQIFQRSELSQETLDWLDWYLALPEEEQLAVNYVPAELNRGRDTGTQDAYGSEKVAGSTTMVSLPTEVLAYTENLSVGMSREAVHALLGEPSFSSSSLFSDTYELDPGSFERQLGIYYEMDGTVCQVRYFSDGTDPNCTGIDLTPFLTASGVDQPTYVDPDSVIDSDSTDGGYTLIDYDVKLPEIDENGVSRVYDDEGNLIVVGEPRYAPEDSNLEELKAALEAQWKERLEAQILEYLKNDGSVRPSSGPYDLCKSKNCDVPYDHCHIDGDVVRIYYENPGLLCAHPDCDNDAPHQHDGTQYAGKAGKYVILNPKLEPVPSAAP